MNESDVSNIIKAVLKEVSNPCLNLKKATALIELVEQEACRIGVQAVIAIDDPWARPIAVHCMDGAYIASYDIAFHKAYTVTALKMSTLELKKLSQPGGSLYGVQHTNGGKIVIIGGGVPLIYQDKIIGGLGVSGGSEEQDSALAQYGQNCLKEVMSWQ